MVCISPIERRIDWIFAELELDAIRAGPQRFNELLHSEFSQLRGLADPRPSSLLCLHVFCFFMHAVSYKHLHF